MFRKILSTLALILVVVGGANASPTWKLRQGDTFYIEEVSNVQMNFRIGLSNEKSEMRVSLVSKITVEDCLANGGYVIKQEVVSGKAKTDGTESNIDMFRGVTFRMTTDRNMQVEKFEGYDDFVRKLTNGDPVAAANFRKAMPEDESKRRMSEPFNLYVRSGAARPDGTWTRERDLTVGPLGTMKMTLKFKNGGDNKVSFTADAKHTFATPTGVGFEFTGGKLDFTGIQGTVLFDNEAGRLNKMEFRVPIKGNVTFQMGGERGEATVSGAVEQTIRVTTTNPAE